MGVIYLLHFSHSYRHARHYLGYTENLEQRLAQHRAGRGSPVLLPLTIVGHLKRSWTPHFAI
jgi:predicted GIY-YIG superfamily endonuclease